MSYREIQRQEQFEEEQRRLAQAQMRPETTQAPEGPGLLENATDLAMGVVSGVNEGVKNIYNVADAVMFDILPDYDVDFGKRTTVVGQAAEGIAEFATAFVPVAGWLGRGGKILGGFKVAKGLSTAAEKTYKLSKASDKLEKAAKAAGATKAAINIRQAESIARGMGSINKISLGRSVLAGAITDNVIYTKDDENLSSLLVQFPGLKDSALEYLAIDEDDSELVSRLKYTIEGMGLGLLSDGILYGLKRVRKGRQLREADPDITADALARKVDEAVGPPPEVGDPDFIGPVPPKKPVEGDPDFIGPQTPIGPQRPAQGPGLPPARPGDGEFIGPLQGPTKGQMLFPDIDPVEAVERRVGEGLLDASDETVVSRGFNTDELQQQSDNLVQETLRREGFDEFGNPRLRGPAEGYDSRGFLISDEELALNEISRRGINLDHIDNGDSVAALVRSTEKMLSRAGKDKVVAEGFDEVAARDAVIEEMADLHGMDSASAAVKLTSGIEGATLSEQAVAMRNRVVALKNVYGGLATSVKTLSDKVIAGQASSAEIASMYRAVDALVRTTKAYSDVKSVFGQGLRSLGMDSWTDLDIPRQLLEPQQVNDILQRAGGMKGAQKFAMQMSGLIGEKQGAAAAKALNDALEPTWFQTFTKVHQELYLNALLGAPKTLALAGTGFANAYWKGLQRMLGASIDATDKFLFNRNNQAERAVAKSELFEAARYNYEILVRPLHHFKESLKFVTDSALTGQSKLIPGSSMRDASGAKKGIDGATADNVARLLGDPAWLRGDAPMGKYLLDGGLLSILKMPSRAMMSFDEAAKQFQARATAAAKLAGEYEVDRARLLKIGREADLGGREEYIAKRMNRLIKDGQLFSKQRVYEDQLAKLPEGLSEAQRRNQALAMTKEFFDSGSQRYGALAKFAKDDALDTTFQTPLTEGGFGARFDAMIRAVPGGMGYMIAPFRKTPVNIINSAMRHIDFMSALKYSDARRDGTQAALASLKKSNSKFLTQMTSGDPLQRAEAIGRLASGLGLVAVGMELAQPDADTGLSKITGRGPQDPKVRDLWLQAGNQPYSIRVGDGWYSYQKLDPWATLLGLVSDFYDVARFSDAEGEEQQTAEFLFNQIFVGVTNNIVDKSYLTGIRQLLDATSGGQDTDGVNRLFRSMAASHIPNFLGGPTRESNNELKHVRSVMDAVMERIPGLSEGLEPKRNILGEPIKATGSAFSKEPGGVTDFFMPIAYTRVSDDAIANELSALQYRFSNPPNKRNGIDWAEIKDEKGRSAYDYWLARTGEVEIGGQTMRQRLKTLIKNPKYQELDPRSYEGLPSARAKQIQRIISAYRGKAKAETLQAYPQLRFATEQRMTNIKRQARGEQPIFGIR